MGSWGTLFWIVFVVCLLHGAVPSDYMRQHRDQACDAIYYVVWVIVLGGALGLHYTIMAQAELGLSAIRADGVALLLYLLGHVGLNVIRHRWGAETSQPAQTSAVKRYPPRDDHLSYAQTVSPPHAAYTQSLTFTPKER